MRMFTLRGNNRLVNRLAWLVGNDGSIRLGRLVGLFRFDYGLILFRESRLFPTSHKVRKITVLAFGTTMERVTDGIFRRFDDRILKNVSGGANAEPD